MSTSYADYVQKVLSSVQDKRYAEVVTGTFRLQCSKRKRRGSRWELQRSLKLEQGDIRGVWLNLPLGKGLDGDGIGFLPSRDARSLSGAFKQLSVVAEAKVESVAEDLRPFVVFLREILQSCGRAGISAEKLLNQALLSLSQKNAEVTLFARGKVESREEVILKQLVGRQKLLSYMLSRRGIWHVSIGNAGYTLAAREGRTEVQVQQWTDLTQERIKTLNPTLPTLVWFHESQHPNFAAPNPTGFGLGVLPNLPDCKLTPLPLHSSLKEIALDVPINSFVHAGSLAPERTLLNILQGELKYFLAGNAPHIRFPRKLAESSLLVVKGLLAAFDEDASKETRLRVITR